MAQKKCDHCSKSIPAGAKFCPYCGMELAADVPIKKLDETVHEEHSKAKNIK
ncbi:zinc-ribbon domain-containing protein [Patescibacteria group bacterium]